MKRNGFTLIELSIALVIIGLIVGGVLVGQDLIESAKLRNTVGQYQKFQAAVNTFKLKYNGIPGDLKNPTQFGFPSITSSGTSTAGNKLIESSGTTSRAGRETTHFWYQLSSSDLIEERIDTPPSGALGTRSAAQILLNFPNTKIKGGLWVVYSASSKNYFGIWGLGAQTDTYNNGYRLTPLQSLRIDEKIDDSAPGTGIVRSLVKASYLINVLSTSTSCATSATAYNVSTTSAAKAVTCAIRIDAGF